VAVHCDETGQDWLIPIVANTVARPKSAVAFVFDHSGSMSEDAGDGFTKVQKLRQAANTFVSVMLQGDGIGIVRFDDTAQILMPITDVGPAPSGAGRTTAQGIINSPQLDPAGNTSVGDGVRKGKQALDDAQALGTPHYDATAMVVLTDGEETSVLPLSPP
jgi:Mg-chelatase subunit ChlD